VIPYQPDTQFMRGEEQEALVAIFNEAYTYTPGVRLNLANRIIAAGFHRTAPRKVTRTQLWSYFLETVLLGICAHTVFGAGLMLVYGALVALTLGSLLTWVGGLIINAGIDKEARK
jgi:hypothetical protein